MLSIRGVRLFLATPAVLVVLVILVAFSFRAFGIEFSKNMRLRRELAKLKADVAMLEGSSHTLTAELGALQRPFAVEREARVKYGLKKSGERVLIIPEEAASDGTKEVAQASSRSAWRTNALAWWKYFERD